MGAFSDVRRGLQDRHDVPPGSGSPLPELRAYYVVGRNSSEEFCRYYGTLRDTNAASDAALAEHSVHLSLATSTHRPRDD